MIARRGQGERWDEGVKIMQIRRGIAVARGVAFGPALVLGSEDFRVPQRFVSVDAVETEISRFRVAFEAVCQEISQNEQLASAQLGKQYGAIFRRRHLQLRAGSEAALKSAG